MTKKPICFIAMAFGREETEKFYEQRILPFLKKNQITPIIINRQEKNQDLNIQIIEAIQKCNFAIVDLTYARPSVYYEAGYAERKVEVIYTVRKDHLYKNQPEDLRVHFDLQMKNLIVWKDLEDDSFSTRLEKRLQRTALKEWNAKQKVVEEEQIGKDYFGLLTPTQREKEIRKSAIKELKKIGFRKWGVWKDYIRPPSEYKAIEINNGLVNNIFSIRILEKLINVVSINTYASLTKKDLLFFYNTHRSDDTIRQIPQIILEENKSDLLQINHFIFTIRDITRSTIDDVTELRRLPNNNSIYFNFYGPGRIYRNKKSLSVRYFLHFKTRIDSSLRVIELLKKDTNNPLLGLITS